MPQRAIAEAVHLSAPAVQRRIRKLQDSGVIRANVAVLDAAKIGLPLTIITEVHIENERPELDPDAMGRPLTLFIAVQLVNELDALTAGFRARVAAEPAVQQCYSVTGEADYVLIVTVASMADYEALTRRLFEGDDNIRRFRTSVTLGWLKSSMQLPLDKVLPGG